MPVENVAKRVEYASSNSLGDVYFDMMVSGSGVIALRRDEDVEEGSIILDKTIREVLPINGPAGNSFSRNPIFSTDLRCVS